MDIYWMLVRVIIDLEHFRIEPSGDVKGGVEE